MIWRSEEAFLKSSKSFQFLFSIPSVDISAETTRRHIGAKVDRTSTICQVPSFEPVCYLYPHINLNIIKFYHNLVM